MTSNIPDININSCYCLFSVREYLNIAHISHQELLNKSFEKRLLEFKPKIYCQQHQHIGNGLETTSWYFVNNQPNNICTKAQSDHTLYHLLSQLVNIRI